MLISRGHIIPGTYNGSLYPGTYIRWLNTGCLILEAHNQWHISWGLISRGLQPGGIYPGDL